MNKFFQDNKWAAPIVVGVLGFLGLSFVGVTVLTEKITNRVIQKLQKEYSPSPYGPGLDPDKIDPKTKKLQPASWTAEWEEKRR